MVTRPLEQGQSLIEVVLILGTLPVILHLIVLGSSKFAISLDDFFLQQSRIHSVQQFPADEARMFGWKILQGPDHFLGDKKQGSGAIYHPATLHSWHSLTKRENNRHAVLAITTLRAGSKFQRKPVPSGTWRKEDSFSLGVWLEQRQKKGKLGPDTGLLASDIAKKAYAFQLALCTAEAAGKAGGVGALASAVTVVTSQTSPGVENQACPNLNQMAARVETMTDRIFESAAYVILGTAQGRSDFYPSLSEQWKIGNGYPLFE